MKAKKVMAVLLAVALMGSAAGCAKVKAVTADDFIAACEKLGAVETDYDDASASDDSDLEDGMYVVLDSDQVEEIFAEASSSSSSAMMGVSAPDINSIIEPEDIEQMVILVRAEQNFDDITDADDIADLDVDAVVAAHVSLTSADLVEDIMDGLADSLDDVDIDVENLSADEYYVGKNEGYLRVNISAEDLIAAFLESDTAGYLEAMGTDTDIFEGLTGNVCLATYINGENMVIVMGAGVNNTTASLDDFCGYIGLQSPSKLDSNPEVAQSIVDYIDNTVGALIGAFASYAG